ncbi:MAG: sulfite exporter TauE/SafE family protein [Pseudomonadota bacterium]
MEFSLFDYALLAIAGVLAGWVNVLAGGGSLFTVPAMVFLGLPGPVANGTNRIAIIAQNIVSVGAFRAQGFADFRLSATLALCAAVGAYFGAQIGVGLDGVWFNRTLAVVIVLVMVAMAGEGREPSKPKADSDHSSIGKPRNVVLGHVLMAGAGVWGGFIQVGSGFLMMPILYRVMGLDLVRVNMHKVFIALVYSIVALGVFATQVPIDWRAGAALALGNAIGGGLGATSTVKKGAPLVKRVLFLALAAMVVKLVFFP